MFRARLEEVDHAETPDQPACRSAAFRQPIAVTHVVLIVYALMLNV